MRAVHQLFDAYPRILDDPISARLIGPEALQQIHDPANRYRIPSARELRAHVVLRSRFAEDRLAGAVADGAKQYILLGAGFDTFAFRQPAWARELKIIEVDHPATQAVKRNRLALAGLTESPNTQLVTIDFERESLLDGLNRCSVAVDQLTFFSWLGVTMYLQEAAIDAVLRSVALFPAGSQIVLSFTQPPANRVTTAGEAPRSLAQRVAAIGEPFISYFGPEVLEVKLHQSGFSKVEFLSSAEARELYFKNRPDDLGVPPRIGLVSAVV
jgi:methyltransferase (TIGR00027 family)